MDVKMPTIKYLKKGTYQVLDILGVGGFGTTYRCVDRRNGRPCAIKEYMPEAIASRNLSTGMVVPETNRSQAFLHGKKRFLEEADILIKMNHIPSVVHVWETFQENNTAYYVMEYLEGKTLRQLMRAMGGRLPYLTAVEAITKVGNALDMVHRQAKIFHRDISPENIMVLVDGSVKIIDFGSAKSTSIAENQHFSVILKHGFAPPEQYASNMSQGSFTDVYALAGTFYCIASGQMIPPAPDRVMGSTYEKLHKLVPECSEQTSMAIDQALHLDAKFRTQTMWEFVKGIKAGVTEKSLENNMRIPQKTEKSVEIRTQDVAAWIEVTKGSCVGSIFPLKPNVKVVVGRSNAKCQYVITGHPEVSGSHFTIWYAPEKAGFYIIDESTNGLYYKGIRLKKGAKYKILPGDQVGIGSMQCMITVGVR